MSTITATASREVAESDGEVMVGLEVIGDGELSAASITIAAGSTMGAATVTATEDDDDYEDESLTVVARGAGEATLTIMVSDNDEAPEPTSITLSGPEDMNLVEGMSYEITAMANGPVTEDTMVELVQTDGTASPADYEVENITIMAGETMGSAMLMVNADEMTENADNMAEMLTLEGRVGAMKTNALSFYLWDAAVPALPIIAQLLLAAFLAIGGYRRYLRR